jgi:hypothetical protein
VHYARLEEEVAMKVLAAATLAIACAIGFAPAASASDKDYLDSVVYKFAAYTPQQLLTAGYKVCAVVNANRPSPEAIPVVIAELNTSTSVASDIVTAAITKLPC